MMSKLYGENKGGANFRWKEYDKKTFRKVNKVHHGAVPVTAGRCTGKSYLKPHSWVRKSYIKQLDLN